MTIDSKQLAQDIARVMELDAKRPTNPVNFTVKLKELYADTETYVAFNTTLERACHYHVAADIIRRQQDVIRELVGAMQKAKEVGCVRYLDTCDDGGEFWHSALALAEPLQDEIESGLATRKLADKIKSGD